MIEVEEGDFALVVAYLKYLLRFYAAFPDVDLERGLRHEGGLQQLIERLEGQM